MTLTAMRPEAGLGNGRDVSLLRVAQVSGADLGLQRCLERLVGVVRAEEIGVADEEAFLVVVGVDEPAGDAVGAVAAHLPGIRVEDVDTVDSRTRMAIFAVLHDVDIGLAEDHEQIALAGVLEVAGHVEVGVHARLEHRDAPELLELGRMGVVAEGAGDQHVEPGVRGLARRGHQVGPRHGAELGADEDARAALDAVPAALDIPPLGADVIARPGYERGEANSVFPVGLLDPGASEVFEDDLGEILRLVVAEFLVGEPVE